MFQLRKRWFLIIFMVALIAAPIAAAEKLNIEDIPGEGKVVGPFGKIDVVGWDWGARSRATSASGGGSYRTGVSDITFTKITGTASSLLQQSSSKGSRYPEIMFKTVDTKGRSVVLRLKNAVVTSVRPIGGGKENVVFNFESFEVQPKTLK